MTEKDFVNHEIKRNKDHFASEHGSKALEKLQRETLSQLSTIEFYYTLDNKFYPDSKSIFEVATKIDFINTETWFYKKTAEEFEKKLDYLYTASIIILEYWMNNLLPKQLDNPAKMLPDNHLSGCIWSRACMAKFREMYKELEKNFR
jgi:hypothetical protein